MATKIKTDLLRKLADHLLNGKLGHTKFDFGTYNENTASQFNASNSCGTNGCAIGECPIVFPDKWFFNEFGEPSLKGNDSYYQSVELESGKEFFKISSQQYSHLFIPENQKTDWGINLSIRATKEQVASNILAFCDLADKGELYA